MPLVNNYGQVDDLVVRTQSTLEQMKVSDEERDRLVAEVKESFQGDAGTANGELQDRLRTLIVQYNEALDALKHATAKAGGSDGTFRVTDLGQSHRFSGIG
ncbi:hypothetical protein [Nocardia callitridis]|uniref:WXG100 family type VII secretion target n=1 Tax=Nocardia callitridis TaxID=648753 RepID=A0ABP9KRR0_9NOCA